ncbi:uncharacterized protein LOC114953606 [Acropora millepora]|uniref:uncharacterized protein LOC114953606 n=1 Tax=Acropora millepora TaxID=45264 RepID=UPI001CF5F411|nr:uncharacterized protein LOC114953606 [Acropora millepora]
MNKIKDLENLFSFLKTITQESGELNYQDRVIRYQANGRVHSLQWVYDGRAWDVESGISVIDRHHKSKQGAIKHAVKKLIDELKARGLVS